MARPVALRCNQPDLGGSERAVHHMKAAVQRKRFIFGLSLLPTSEGALAKTLQAEGVFPLPLDALWRLLHAHLEDDRIREIHPWILSGRTIRGGEPVEFQGLSFPREKVVERVIRIGIRRPTTTWIYRIDPPTRYRYEIAFPNGSLTRFDNHYSSAEGGTLVKTIGHLSIKRVPSSVALWLVKRSLDRSDEEDLAYAKRFG